MTAHPKSLISSHLLARNVIWNFGGIAAPMIVAVFAVPLLIDGFGKERFGLLAIVWMGVGYFTLFDMGFGRALTKLISDRLGVGNTKDMGSLIWSALFCILVFGIIGTGIVILGADIFISNVMNVDPELQPEGIATMRTLALGLPAVIITAGFIGILEAHQCFATITAVRIPLGVMTFAGPLITMQFSTSLVWATFSLIAVRLAALIVYFFSASSVRPELKIPNPIRKKYIAQLFKFGGWLTVTNIIGPLMVYFDRFFIGAVLTMTAVTYYVTPYEVLSRFMMLPKSILSVLFPALTTALIADTRRLVNIYSQGSRNIFLIVLPVLSGAFLFSPEALFFWLGDDFSQIASPVVRWLSVGWLINTLARMPFILLQSAGRPDLIAKTHLLELIPYFFVLWLLTDRFGISGTAAAWFIRIIVDTVILSLIARSKVSALSSIITRDLVWIPLLIIGFGLSSMIESLFLRIFIFLVILIVSFLFVLPVIWKTYSIRSGKGT